MINIILASAVFDILGPPPGYFKEPSVVEDVVKEETAPTPPAIEKADKENQSKAEPVSNNGKAKAVKKNVKQDSSATFRKTVKKIIKDIQDEPIETVVKIEPTTEVVTNEDVSNSGEACSKIEIVEITVTDNDEKVVEVFEEPIDEPKEELHYYLYTGVNCRYCVLLLTELEANVDAKNISVIENARKTKSGKVIQYYPVLEVYRGEDCIYHGVGYRKWSDLTKVINK